MIQITSNPLSPELIANNLMKDEYGNVITFTGMVRNTCQEGNPVAFLEVEACGEDAETKLHEIASEIYQKWQLQDVAICRRIGTLKVGEIALVVAVAAPHRQEAFQACQYAVDRIKQGGVTTEKDICENGESFTGNRK